VFNLCPLKLPRQRDYRLATFYLWIWSVYSRLLLDEQRQYIEQLTEIVRRTEQVRSAKEAGKLIRLPVGDGMALVFLIVQKRP
jgi:hypothetical protein